MSTSSPVIRVAASTRAAVLTGSPITVKSRRPPPPIVPADDAAGVHAHADAEPAAEPPADQPGDLPRGRDGARRVIGVALGRAEHGEQAVADELVGVPAVPEDHRDDRLVELVERRDDLAARRRARRTP